MAVNPKNRRIAILGGTFDPIHNGHLVLGREIRKHFEIDELLLIPAYIQPFKTDRKITPSELRLKMVQLAIEEDPCFTVSSLEIDRGAVSYTCDTIRLLSEMYGEGTELFFITGADAFMLLDHWKNAEWLLGHCSFIAASRPGYEVEKLEAKAQELRENFPGAKIYWLEVDTPDVSSTLIREKCRRGESLEGLVPFQVERFIRTEGLYRDRDEALETIENN